MKKVLRKEKGFTLIELLIVVAILGVLAAVVIPNVGRFLGRGQTEADKAELHNVQSAVIALMTDHGITQFDTPVASTADMTAFPATANNTGETTAVGSVDGYLLRGHDKDKSDAAADNINYVTFDTTACAYVADTFGTITQTCT